MQIVLAAVGIVLMQTSVALFEFGFAARGTVLAVGLCFIVVGALQAASLISARLVTELTLIALTSAIGFEALSAFNEHLVFEPKLIAFRAICYALIFCGVLIGIALPARSESLTACYATTALVSMIAIAAPLTWRSLQGYVIAEGTRGSFDESSPVALGFSGGALAVAALTIALRSPRVVDWVIGSVGYAAWFVVCLQSGSRGSLVFLMLTALMLCAIWIRLVPLRVALFIAIALALVTGLVAIDGALATQVAYVTQRLESMLLMDADASLAGGVFSRAYLLNHNLNLPGLFLVGGEKFDPAAYPHNFAVEAVVRMGVWAGCVFIIGVIYLLWTQIGILRKTECSVPLAVIIAMGLFTFFNSQTNLMWEFLRPLWLSLGIVIGLLIALRNSMHAARMHSS